jgi:hypothetical protein
MPDSVTVDHGSVSITSNTISEAALRTEMEAPAAESHTIPHDPTPAAPVRDAQGRYVKAEAAAPPEAGAPSDPAPPGDPAATPARRRDDTLPRHNPIARLNQVLAQKAEAERRAAQLEAELQRVRPPGVTPTVTPPVLPPPPAAPAAGPPEPLFDQFADQADPYTAYLQAWTRWDRQQAITQARAEWDAAQTEKAKAQTFQQRLTAGKAQFADFDQVLTQADTLGLQVSAVMQEAIAASPQAADLVYYLATHPEECTQLAEESLGIPVAAATVMQRLLESHLAPRAAPVKNGSGPAARAPVSTAKPPVTPVGSSPVVSDEPPGEAASAAEHARYWNRRLKVPGTR